MDPKPISIQLYSVREQAAADFPSVLRQIADIGYTGVEFAGFHGYKPEELRSILDDLGMVTSSVHGPLPTDENAGAIVETARILGYTHHVAGFGRPQFESLEKTREAGEMARRATEALAGWDLEFGLHNHDFEFDKRFEGRLPHEIMMDAAPDAFAELDTYWVKVGGEDPADRIRQLGARAPLLHIKDGPGVREKPMTAVGDGIMDWPRVMAAVSDVTEWLIVEIDRCDGNMMEAVARSYRFLTENGYASGRK